MLRNISLTAAALLATIGAANAAVTIGGITGGTARTNGGTFLSIAAPTAVGFDNFNDDNLRAFNEVQNFTLTSALVLNSGGTLAAGTVISSHLVIFDPAGARNAPVEPTLGGFVEFNARVLGVIWRDATLAATNGLLGISTTNYLTPVGVGLEQGSDFFTIAPSGNVNRVAINFFTANTPGDVMRVITARSPVAPAVPEPATWLSMILGFGLVGAFARRRLARAVAA